MVMKTWIEARIANDWCKWPRSIDSPFRLYFVDQQFNTCVNNFSCSSLDQAAAPGSLHSGYLKPTMDMDISVFDIATKAIRWLDVINSHCRRTVNKCVRFSWRTISGVSFWWVNGAFSLGWQQQRHVAAFGEDADRYGNLITKETSIA